MQIWEKIKEKWPLVTKTRFNRLKSDRNALLKEHKNMSDYVLMLNDQVSDSTALLSRAIKILNGIEL